MTYGTSRGRGHSDSPTKTRAKAVYCAHIQHGEFEMTDAELETLLVETGHKHHEAYAESDGADPDWALWYASFLQARIWDGLGRLLSRSDIVYLLMCGDREARASDDPSQWPSIYIRLFRDFAAE